MNNEKVKVFSIVFLMGALSSIMITMNSLLSGFVGLALSGVIVHATGLVLALILFCIYDSKLLTVWPQVFKKKAYLFTAGLIGAVMIIISAYSIQIAGVFICSMAMTAGQFILSFIIDQKGYFGFEKVKFTSRKMICLVVIAAGIIMISM